MEVSSINACFTGAAVIEGIVAEESLSANFQGKGKFLVQDFWGRMGGTGQ
ncbi:MAG: hypothetical protein SPD95_00425 [Candidatus Faecousia sp.]|nr:hypothetical protein [Candidatus Faecousia sp.]